MSESDTQTDRIDNATGTPTNPVLRLIADLMSNRHRGYAGLRQAGGVHPVPTIGTERGGKNAEFDTDYSEADVIAMLRDGLLAGNRDHVLRVVPDGPFSGYTLPAHGFQPGQHAFPVLGATDIPQPFRVVGASGARLQVKLKVVALTATKSIFIGNNENVSPTNGYPLTVVNEVLDLDVRQDIWACSNDSTAQAILAVLSTTRDGGF
jgi:hypothetical protein